MPVDSAASERPVTAELRITTEDMLRLATRATDEEAIRDINLYLFGRSNGQSLHFYSRSALVRFECLPGEYDLYVAANLGADLPTWVRTWASGVRSSSSTVRSGGRRSMRRFPCRPS